MVIFEVNISLFKQEVNQILFLFLLGKNKSSAQKYRECIFELAVEVVSHNKTEDKLDKRAFQVVNEVFILQNRQNGIDFS